MIVVDKVLSSTSKYFTEGLPCSFRRLIASRFFFCGYGRIHMGA